MNETILAVCHTHDLSWNVDMDPPQCGCEYELMVIEEMELPFYAPNDVPATEPLPSPS